MKTEDAVEGEIVGGSEGFGVGDEAKAVRRGLDKFAVSAGGEGAEGVFAEEEPEIDVGFGVEGEDGLGGEEGVAAVVAFAGEDEEAWLIRE